jgi:hypothetical protein
MLMSSIAGNTNIFSPIFGENILLPQGNFIKRSMIKSIAVSG